MECVRLLKAIQLIKTLKITSLEKNTGITNSRHFIS